MASMERTLITDAGKELFNSAIGGENKIVYTTAELIYNENLSKLSDDDLRNSKKNSEIVNSPSLLSGNIHVSNINDTTVTVGAEFLNSSLADSITFVGIKWYATTTLEKAQGNSSVCFAISELKTPTDLVSGSFGDGQSTSFFLPKIAMTLDNAPEVVIKPTEEGLVTHIELEERIEQLYKIGLINGGKVLPADTNVYNLHNTSLQYINSTNITGLPKDKYGNPLKGYLASIGGGNSSNNNDPNSSNSLLILFSPENKSTYISYYQYMSNEWSDWIEVGNQKYIDTKIDDIYKKIKKEIRELEVLNSDEGNNLYNSTINLDTYSTLGITKFLGCKLHSTGKMPNFDDKKDKLDVYGWIVNVPIWNGATEIEQHVYIIGSNNSGNLIYVRDRNHNDGKIQEDFQKIATDADINSAMQSTIRKITVNKGEELKPDANGAVNIDIPKVDLSSTIKKITVNKGKELTPDNSGAVNIDIPEPDLSPYVKSVENNKPDKTGNVNLYSNVLTPINSVVINSKINQSTPQYFYMFEDGLYVFTNNNVILLDQNLNVKHKASKIVSDNYNSWGMLASSNYLLTFEDNYLVQRDHELNFGNRIEITPYVPTCGAGSGWIGAQCGYITAFNHSMDNNLLRKYDLNNLNKLKEISGLPTIEDIQTSLLGDKHRVFTRATNSKYDRSIISEYDEDLNLLKQITGEYIDMCIFDNGQPGGQLLFLYDSQKIYMLDFDFNVLASTEIVTSNYIGLRYHNTIACTFNTYYPDEDIKIFVLDEGIINTFLVEKNTISLIDQLNIPFASVKNFDSLTVVNALNNNTLYGYNLYLAIKPNPIGGLINGETIIEFKVGKQNMDRTLCGLFNTAIGMGRRLDV